MRALKVFFRSSGRVAMISTALLGASACAVGATEGDESGQEPAAFDETEVPSAGDEVDKDICVARGDRVATLTAFEGWWGSWSCSDWCPPGTFAYGLNLKAEPSRGSSGDDTALNGVSLHCYDRNTTDFVDYATAAEGPWGGWYSEGPTSRCPDWSRPIKKVQVRAEKQLGSGDDTVMNHVSAVCGDDTILTPVSPTSWGTLRPQVACPDGTAVCGLSTKVEPKQGSGDDTALNGLKVECCKVCPRNQVFCDGVCKASSECSAPPVPR